MNDTVFVIFYDDFIVCVVTNIDNKLSSNDILNKYSENYCFERNNLKGYHVESVTLQEILA